MKHLQRHVETLLGRKIIRGTITDGDVAEICVEDGKLSIHRHRLCVYALFILFRVNMRVNINAVYFWVQ